MSRTDRKTAEQLMNAIGNVKEQYVREYMEAQSGIPDREASPRTKRPGKIRLSLALAAVMVLLLGTVSVAAVAAIGHFLVNLANERESILKNVSELETYFLPIGETEECDGVTGTLNSVLLEDHYLLFNYTFDWSGLEEAQDGSFHTWFLPWFFYVESDGAVICQSEYGRDLHTQSFPLEGGTDFSDTYLYCIDLGDTKGESLVGRELTLRLLYSAEGEGFVNTFSPETCLAGREWQIGRTFDFQGNTITLDSVRESALYVTLFIDCGAIGHVGDEYQFVLSDELGNDFSVFPYEDEDTNGYWFTKPETVGAQLTLKIVRSRMASDPQGNITDDSYDVLLEIPIELKSPLPR